MSSKHLDTKNQAAGGADRGDGPVAGLLSPMAYDDDASSIHSRSDQDSDSDDDELQLRARNSRELLAADRIVLMEEEELDRLVTTTRQQQERRRRPSGGLSVPNPLRIFGRRGMSTTSLSGTGSASPSASTENLVADAEKKRARRTRRRQKRERLLERARDGEDGELMYEMMEEGGVRDGGSTGESTERDGGDRRRRRRQQRRLSVEVAEVVQNARERERRRRRRRCGSSSSGSGSSWPRWLFVHALIASGFAMLVLIAWKLSRSRPGPPPAHRPTPLVSNGTALFAPTTLILSLDGFRADFLHRGLTPRLSALVREGVSPAYMTPSFPSLTFPNHYSLATGLYPEAHGIIGNTFWDPDLGAEFYYTDPARSLDPRWWEAGEPFWVSAEKQGVRTAVHMWPGSEAPIQGMFASIVDKFNDKEALDKKVDRILSFLDLPGPSASPSTPLSPPPEQQPQQRPQLVAAYVPDVDADGHRYGPNSTEIQSTIRRVDSMLDDLFRGLEARNLTHIVNVIVVSDHGMATTDASRLVQLEDLLDMALIEHTDGWPLYGLRPFRHEDVPVLYAQLKDKARQHPEAAFEVYLRDGGDMPARYHFTAHERIAPLWIVPRTGWAIVRRSEFDVEEGRRKGLVYHPRGLHGYDHEDALMRAIFVARGPAFPHEGNSRVEPFQNTNVYNLLCDTLGITPAPNNGTLRLPLRPTGTHDPAASQEAHPPDPPPAPAPVRVRPPLPPSLPPASSSAGEDNADSSLSRPVPPPPAPARPMKATAGDEQTGEGGREDGSPGGRLKVWWDWVAGKADDFWDSVKGSVVEGG